MANKNLDIVGGVKKWLYSLMGKAPPTKTDESYQEVGANQEAEEQQTQIQEDSVSNDIKMLKNFLRKGAESTKTLLTPFARKSTASATEATKVVASSVDKKFIKFTIRSFIIVLFVIVLIYVAAYLFKMLKKENGNVTNGGGVIATPVPIEPYKPSIYANDPEIIMIEEELNILEMELNSVNIKVDGINPPRLDFDISF